MSTSERDKCLVLLSLDGGGSTGLSSLFILREIMWRVRVTQNLESIPLPSDYFHLIGGTGTGGLIAMLLGRCRMSVDSAIDAYIDLEQRAFSSLKRGRSETTFKAAVLKSVLGTIVTNALGHPTAEILDPHQNSTPTFVCTFSTSNLNAGIPRLLRTYNGPKHLDANCSIIDAVHATMATPGIFKPVRIKTLSITEDFIGASLGQNNPIMHVVSEAAVVFPNRYVSAIISIGAGRAKTTAVPSHKLGWSGFSYKPNDRSMVDFLNKVGTDCETKAEEAMKKFQKIDGLYTRFNVDEGIQDAVDCGGIKTHVDSYLRRVAVTKSLDEVVDRILNHQPLVVASQIESVTSNALTLGSYAAMCPAPTPLFTGREDILSKMKDYFCDNSRGSQKTFLLYGLGGAGKTQVALRFAHLQHGNGRFERVYFLDASSQNSLEAGLAAISRENRAGWSANDTRRWLAQRRDKFLDEWVLIFDNADDPTLRLRKYFPSCTHGNIIITSRNSSMQSLAPLSNIELPMMTVKESASLFIDITQLSDTTSRSTIEEFTASIGHLPLAIVQAASYIRTYGCTIDAYIRLFSESHRDRLLRRHSDHDQGDYTIPVYAAWDISYARLSLRTKDFLAICAFWSPNFISEALFCRSQSLGFTSFKCGHTFLTQFEDAEGKWSGFDFQEVISELRRFSLINSSNTNEYYVFHPLVHSWMLDVIPPAFRESKRQTAFEVVAMGITSEGADLPQEMGYVVHVMHILGSRGSPKEEYKAITDQFRKLISKFGDKANWSRECMKSLAAICC